MLFSLDRVTDIAWSISSNFGTTSFLVDPATMVDDRPASVTRFIWPTHVPNSAVEVTIEGTFPPSRSHVIGLIHLKGIQRGNVIDITLKRDGSLTYDTPLGTVVVEELQNGALCVWAYVDQEWFYEGIKIKILADNPHMGVIAAGTVIEIGEAWLGTKEIIGVQPGWSVVEEDTTLFRDSENSQPANVAGYTRRVMNFAMCLASMNEIYGEHGGEGTQINQDAFLSVMRRMSQGRPCVCFPRWEETGFPEEERTIMARSAIFGSVRKLGGFAHSNGDYFMPQQMLLREYPIPI